MSTTAEDGKDAGSTAPEVLGLLRDLSSRLSGLAPEVMPAVARREVLVALERASGALTAARGRVLAAVESAGDWKGSGDRSAAAWHGRNSRLGQGQARAQVRQAKTLEQLPEVARAVGSGEVTTAHLDSLARAVEQASGPAREALGTPELQAELVGIARRQDADVFAKTVRRRLAEYDPDQLEDSHAAQRAERYLVVSSTARGLRFQGQLDTVAGQVVRQALEALMPRPTDDDERTPEQRRADALETMAEAVLKNPRTTTGAAVRPHVSLVMTDESFAAHTQLQAARAGATADVSEPRVPFTPVAFEDGTPVPPSVVARVLCDSELTRVVVDAESMPVDVGRTKRYYDGHLRRAVIVRDRTCSWPGCSHHARWCEIHHATWWSRGGDTSIDNGVLLCLYHHQRVHDLDLRITREPLRDRSPVRNGVARVRYEFRRPDGRLFPPEASVGSPSRDRPVGRPDPPSPPGARTGTGQPARPGAVAAPPDVDACSGAGREPPSNVEVCPVGADARSEPMPLKLFE